MSVCTCESPEVALVEGVLVCSRCGELVRDALDEKRDAMLVAIARGVASLDRRLDANGSAKLAAVAPVPRLALTREEAAHALGIGLTSFKSQVQPHLRMIRRGKLRLIPTAELERWLREQAEQPMSEQVES